MWIRLSQLHLVVADLSSELRSLRTQVRVLSITLPVHGQVRVREAVRAKTHRETGLVAHPRIVTEPAENRVAFVLSVRAAGAAFFSKCAASLFLQGGKVVEPCYRRRSGKGQSGQHRKRVGH